MRKYLQRKLIKFIIKDVFNTITKEDILSVSKGKWIWKGKELSDDMIGNIQLQAKSFSNSTLWKVLKAELEWHAVKTLMEKGKDESDIRAAQLLGYLTQVIDKKLSTISEGSPLGEEGDL